MPSPAAVVKNHPNATIAGGSGAGGGVLAVWLLGLAGVELTPEVAAILAGALASAALLIGRKGLRGIWRTIWHGSG